MIERTDKEILDALAAAAKLDPAGPRRPEDRHGRPWGARVNGVAREGPPSGRRDAWGAPSSRDRRRISATRYVAAGVRVGLMRRGAGERGGRGRETERRSGGGSSSWRTGGGREWDAGGVSRPGDGPVGPPGPLRSRRWCLPSPQDAR